MRYHSTKNDEKTFSLSEAILHGLAPDGGLFVPESIPKISLDQFDTNLKYSTFCQHVLQPFFTGDTLSETLLEHCQSAFNFEVPLHKLNDRTYILELFHGPTLSFKDFGARFLAECLNTLTMNTKIMIMVATSGDTGSAVASAFYQKEKIKVVVLFPDGKISERQQQQITCWGDNIQSFAVHGTFDDCQQLVKSAFTDAWWQQHFSLCTANSINIGRLLPQICYYAYTSLKFYRQLDSQPGFIVPSGNLGNVTAACYAQKMGFPIREIVIATNANRVVTDYFETSEFKPRKSIQTLANAMDVGNPSNLARLLELYKDHDTLQQHLSAHRVSDNAITKSIETMFEQYRTIVCPHTATGCWVREQLDDQPWIIAGTADPCKFEAVVEPIIKQTVPLRPKMKDMLQRTNAFMKISPTLSSLVENLSV